MSKAWIDSLIDRLVSLFNWRIADAQKMGLSSEWGRLFGGYQVTQEIIDKAVDICVEQWERVPINVTVEFKKILNRAMMVNCYANQPSFFSKQEEYYKIFDRIVKKIKSKNPDLVGQEGGAEINEMIQSHIRFALQEHPELAKDEPFSVQLIQYAECLA